MVLQHGDGLVEGVGGEEFDVFEMASGGLGDLISSEFRKDDFHGIIIPCW